MTVTHNRSLYSGPTRCRCNLCRADIAKYMKELRAVRRKCLERNYIEVTHGLSSTYENYACRCVECCEAKAKKNRKKIAMSSHEGNE